MFLLASPTINISIKHGLGDGELLNLNNVCANLGVLNCRMTLFMHAFTGCDYTPSFFSTGKSKFFDEMVTNADRYRATFDELSTEPAGVSSEQYAIVQKFVLAAYGEDGYDTIEDLRFDSLRYKVDPSFPKWAPSASAIMEQAKRAAYIAGHLWGRAHVPQPQLPPLTDWGYALTTNGIVIPRWTLVVSADGMYTKLTGKKCGCRGVAPCSTKSCSFTSTRCLPVLCKCRGKCLKDNPIDDDDDEDDD